jgi:hypothetical protein
MTARARQVAALLGLFLVGGCGAEPAPPSAAGSLGAGSAGSSAAVSCKPGALPCFCPDGLQSGTQICDAQANLGACQCSTGASSAELGVAADPRQVCSQLMGMPGCDARSYVSPQLPSSVLFVVDRSGSMACNAPPVQSVDSCNADPKRLDPSRPSRWEITTAALNAAFSGLNGSSAEVALSLFSTDGYCGVDSLPLVGLDAITPDHLMALSGALSASTPAGGTPIVGSVISAYHHLHEEAQAAGNRYVVLITDGEESCGTLGDETNSADLMAARTQLIGTEVQKARAANIKTFVVGVPGSEGARGFLSELAFQGGTARSPNCQHGDATAANGDCHYDLTSQSDLSSVLRSSLSEISGQARGCEFRTPDGGGSVNVQISQNGAAPSCIPNDDRPCDGGANGWQYPTLVDGSPDYGRVTLCGAACDTVKSDPAAVVDVILGCVSLN